MLDTLTQPCSISERDFQNGNAHRNQLLQLLVRKELYFGAFAKDGRILHARLVVRSMEGNGFVEQHDRDQVLQTNIRHLAIVHGIACAGCDPHDDLFYLIRLEGPAREQILQGVQWRLDGPPGGPLLEGGKCYTVNLAEFVDHPGWGGLRIVGLDEIIRARKNISDPSPARMNHERCVHPIARTHATEDESLFDMIGVSPPGADASASLLGGIVEQPAHLLGIQTSSASGSGRRAHGSDQGVGFLHARPDRLHGSHRYVVAECHGTQEMCPADAELLPYSQGCGYYRAAGVCSASGEIIVTFVGMSKLPVGERCLNGSAEQSRCDHRGDLLSTVGLSKLDCCASGR